MKQRYLSIDHAFLAVEREQLTDEGRAISTVASEFDALLGADLDADPSLHARAAALLDACADLPMRADYPYDEPSDLEGIRRARPAETPFWIITDPGDEYLFDHVLAAWLGRCAGCLLGKPVEGWRSPAMWGFLKDQGRYPLADFFRSDALAELYEKHKVSRDRAYIDRVTHMPEDDDTNYTVTGLAIMKQRGAGFVPDDVAEFWLQNVPILHTFTAERAAYRNFINLISPPASATYRNPYREWIGAQIRADFWGYAALGNPKLGGRVRLARRLDQPRQERHLRRDVGGGDAGCRALREGCRRRYQDRPGRDPGAVPPGRGHPPGDRLVSRRDRHRGGDPPHPCALG